MSDNEQKTGRLIRTSSGSTRLSAGGQTRARSSAPAGPGADGWSGPARTAVTEAADPGPAPRSASGPVGMQTGSAPTSVMPQGAGRAGTAAAGADGGAAGAGDAPAAAGNAGAGDSSVRASAGGVRMGGKSTKKGPRTVRLTVAKLDPWSVMKMAFLLSVAIGIATVVAALVLWLVLQATGTLQSLETTLAEVAGTEGADQLLGLFSLGRVLSFSVILALINIVLMTALSTLFAFLYNIGSSIVGGFYLTLTDD